MNPVGDQPLRDTVAGASGFIGASWREWLRRLARSVNGEIGHTRRGSGTPEGALAAPVGTLYLRTDGGASTTLYVKETGTGSTGWVAK